MKRLGFCLTTALAAVLASCSPAPTTVVAVAPQVQEVCVDKSGITHPQSECQAAGNVTVVNNGGYNNGVGDALMWMYIGGAMSGPRYYGPGYSGVNHTTVVNHIYAPGERIPTGLASAAPPAGYTPSTRVQSSNLYKSAPPAYRASPAPTTSAFKSTTTTTTTASRGGFGGTPTSTTSSASSTPSRPSYSAPSPSRPSYSSSSSRGGFSGGGGSRSFSSSS